MKKLSILALALFLGAFSGIAISEKQMAFAQESVDQEYQIQESLPSQEVVLDSVKVEAPAPAEGDPIVTISELIKNWKSMSPVAIGAAIILILVQLLKSSFFGQFFNNLVVKRAFITVLGVAYGVVYLISAGTDVVTALVVGLLASGGAVAIYEAIKPLISKKTA